MRDFVLWPRAAAPLRSPPALATYHSAKDDISDPGNRFAPNGFALACAERPSGPPRLRARPLHLCDAALPQPCARQHLGRGDGGGPAGAKADLAVRAGRARALYGAPDPYGPRLLGPLPTAAVPLDGLRGDAALPRADDPVPASGPCIRDAGRPQSVRGRQGLRPGALQVLVAGHRTSPGVGADNCLGARLHRDPLLARPQACLPAGEKLAAVGRGARADAGAARLRPGRAADPAPRCRSGVAGRDAVAGACRDGIRQRPACCGPQRYGDFPGRDAGRRPARARGPAAGGNAGSGRSG